jgi:peptidoglycan L-alanyl-D-glutamate endopeptidase CwlK
MAETLQQGSSGPNVGALQAKLKTLGFLDGSVDGNFGPTTTGAVMAFQNSKGLSPDGVVGPQTADALGLVAAVAQPSADAPVLPGMPGVTIEIAAKMFPVTPVRNIQANLPTLLAALQKARLTDLPIVLASIATIRAETEGFVPISEGISRFNTSPGGPPFGLYDNRADIGNRGPTDGADYKGRGYVQLTGRANYAKYGPLIGVPDLVDNPDKANDSNIAAAILAAFVQSKKTAISAALARNDLAAACRLVNGGSNGLDRFSEAYQTGMKLMSPA